MKIIKIDVEGRKIEFVCSSRDTRNGFAHDATIFIDGDEWGCGHAYYLNRTWERYTYESVCLSACSDLIAKRKSDLREWYKMDNGLDRVSKKADKDALAARINRDYDIKLLSEIKDVLSTKVF